MLQAWCTRTRGSAAMGRVRRSQPAPSTPTTPSLPSNYETDSGALARYVPLRFIYTERKRILLPAATKLGQGNVFTSVCLSTGRGGGVSASVHAGIPPWSRPPRTRHTPPGPDTPPPRPDTHPRPGTPPGKQTAAYG